MICAHNALVHKGGDFINYSLSFPSYLSYPSYARMPFAAASPAAVSGQPGTGRLRGQAGRSVAGQKDLDTYECQTCKNRTYQDGSNDPSVSFKMPTKLSPERAAYAIRSHEMEHVAHAHAQAQRENQEIVSQSVTYHTGICPECGRTYLAGGNTRTVFRSSPETYEAEPVQKGANIDLAA